MKEIKYKTVEEMKQMSSAEIQEYQMQLEEHLKDFIHNREIINQEKLELERKLHELRTRLSKGRSIISEIRITLELAKQMFWAQRNEGL